MAKRTATRTQTKVVQVRAPAPIVVAAPRSPARRRRSSAPAKRKHHRRRSSSGGSVGALTPMRLFQVGLGGGIYGYVEKSFPNMPTLPFVGKSGTIALLALVASKQGGFGHMGIVKDVGIAAAAIAGYSLGKTGKVSGDVDGDAFEQV